MNLETILKEIEDYLVPKLHLNILERSLYYYLLRHTRLIGKELAVFSLTPLAQALFVSDYSIREKVRSMNEKGCIRIEERTTKGHIIRVFLPEEIDGLLAEDSVEPNVNIDEIDFFSGRMYVDSLVKRENGKCFYCLRRIKKETCVLDHVIPRADHADNSYRNIVACCHECNSLKQNINASDFLRTVYRKGLLSQPELEDRLAILECLLDGKFVPEVQAN